MDYSEQISYLKLEDYPQKAKHIAILKQLQKQEEDLPQEMVMNYASKIKPVMRGNARKVSIDPDEYKNGTLFWIPSVPIHTQSVTFKTSKPLCQAQGLKEIARIVTYHRYGGYYGFLRPSTDEAIIQCPKEILDKVCAFEFVAETLDFGQIYNHRLDRHVLTTVYYAGTLPDQIATQCVKW